MTGRPDLCKEMDAPARPPRGGRMRKRSRLGATDGEYSSGSDDEYEGDGAHAGRSAVP